MKHDTIKLTPLVELNTGFDTIKGKKNKGSMPAVDQPNPKANTPEVSEKEDKAEKKVPNTPFNVKRFLKTISKDITDGKTLATILKAVKTEIDPPAETKKESKSKKEDEETEDEEDKTK